MVKTTLIHILASHLTFPDFDVPEGHNGCRNADKIRLFSDYLAPDHSHCIRDDAGGREGLPASELFLLLGDLNTDPVGGGSVSGSIAQVLKHARH